MNIGIIACNTHTRIYRNNIQYNNVHTLSYRIARNVCEELYFMVCNFGSISQTYPSANIICHIIFIGSLQVVNSYIIIIYLSAPCTKYTLGLYAPCSTNQKV